MKRVPAALIFAAFTALSSGAPVKALLIDGPEWQAQTPTLKAILEDGGLVQLDVVSAPTGADASNFQPQFDKYKVVILNYGGQGWSVNTLAAFDKYVQNGGGLVALAPAGAAFPAWTEFNLMIGLSGASNRNEKAGPIWFYKDGNLAYDTQTPGEAGKSPQTDQPFPITIRNTEHPIMKGLPLIWMHSADQMQGRLRGPGKNMVILATAHSDPERGGTGLEEPQLLAITYGKGRVFHTFLGRGAEALACVGYEVTLRRGAEWAATGKVTQKVPADFPTEQKVSLHAPTIQGARR
jgi:uncharacterized protein